MGFSRVCSGFSEQHLVQLSTPKFGKFLRVDAKGYLEETGFLGKLFEELKEIFRLPNACSRHSIAHSLKRLTKQGCKSGWVKAEHALLIAQVARRAGLIDNDNSQKDDQKILRLIAKVSALALPPQLESSQHMPPETIATSSTPPQENADSHCLPEATSEFRLSRRDIAVVQLPADDNVDAAACPMPEEAEALKERPQENPLPSAVENQPTHALAELPQIPDAPVQQTTENGVCIASLVKKVAVPILVAMASAWAVSYFYAPTPPAHGQGGDVSLDPVPDADNTSTPLGLQSSKYALVAMAKTVSAPEASLSEKASDAGQGIKQPKFEHSASPYYVLDANFEWKYKNRLPGLSEDAHCILFGALSDKHGIMQVPSLEEQKQAVRALKFTYHPDKRTAHPEECRVDGCKQAYSNIAAAQKVVEGKGGALEPGTRVLCGLPPASRPEGSPSTAVRTLHPMVLKSEFSEKYADFKGRYKKFMDKQLGDPRKKKEFEKLLSKHRSVTVGKELDRWNNDMQFFDGRTMGPRMEPEQVKRAYCLLYSDQEKSSVTVPSESVQSEMRQQALVHVSDQCRQAGLTPSQCMTAFKNIDAALDLTATFKITPGEVVNCGQKKPKSWKDWLFGRA